MGEVSQRVWPLGGYAPGDYSCECTKCGKQFEADKRAYQCLECAVQWAKSLLRARQALLPAGTVTERQVLVSVPMPSPCTTVEIGGTTHILMEPSVLRKALSGLDPVRPAEPVAVKGLTWKDNSPSSIWTGELIFQVYYTIYDEGTGWRAFRGRFMSEFEASEIAFAPSLTEAKAAAQADYEARIRSTLVSATPPMPDSVARLIGLMGEVIPALEATGYNVSLAKDVRAALASITETGGAK